MRRTMEIGTVLGIALIGVAPKAIGDGPTSIDVEVDPMATTRGASTLVETFSEDFESFAPGTPVDDIAQWVAGSATLQDLSGAHPEFGSRTPLLGSLPATPGMFLVATAPPAPFFRPGVGSMDVVADGLSADDIVWVTIDDRFQGIAINRVFFQGDGDIAYLDRSGLEVVVVDSGVDWTPGTVQHVEFELTLGGEALIRVNGVLIAIAPNFAADSSGLVGFSTVSVVVTLDEVSGGTLAFDNVRYEQVQLPGLACPSDLDGDGDTDSGDLAILLGSWGVCPQ